MPKYPDGFHPDRRRGPDSLVIVSRVLAWFVWPILLAAFLMVSYARPQMESFFDRILKVQLRTWWDQTLLLYVFYLMIAGLIIAVSGLLLISLRKRRKTDKYPFSMLFLLIVSLIVILIYIF